jgi:hypothetical protein
MTNKALIAIGVSLVIVAAALFLAGQSLPERPVKDGVGPLAVKLDPNVSAPSTHSPLDWWQKHHPNVVNNGDLREQDCLYCHNASKSCNNCHSYVGAKVISNQ